jgi:hypothetical protein
MIAHILRGCDEDGWGTCGTPRTVSGASRGGDRRRHGAARPERTISAPDGVGMIRTCRQHGNESEHSATWRRGTFIVILHNAPRQRRSSAVISGCSGRPGAASTRCTGLPSMYSKINLQAARSPLSAMSHSRWASASRCDIRRGGSPSPIAIRSPATARSSSAADASRFVLRLFVFKSIHDPHCLVPCGR